MVYSPQDNEDPFSKVSMTPLNLLFGSLRFLGDLAKGCFGL